MEYPQVKRAIEVIKALHHPQTGCAWDLEQTHKSLLKYLLEEAYEFIEACEKGDKDHIREELGDVFLQVLHHATMAEKEGNFNIEDVAQVMADKMIRRHPHVFGEKAGRMSSSEIIEAYKEIKIKEKGEVKYAFKHKLLHAPGLESAFRIGEISATVNFDWDDHLQVMMKV